MRQLLMLFLLFTFSKPIEAAIHSFGDSHSVCSFIGIPECKSHLLGPITMHRVGRDKLNIINLRKLGVQENDTVIFVFGEIDVRCHIGKQRDLMKRDENEIIQILARKYIATILENRSLFQNLRCIIFAVLPPTEQCFNPSFPYYGTLKDRIQLTKKLNCALTSQAALYGIKILDVYDDYATKEGYLRPELSDGLVHINPKCTQFVRKKLYALLD